MRRALAMIAAVTLGLGLIGGEADAASAYQQVLTVYEREGAVAPCQFTPAQLQAALGGVDTYGAQYFADFTQAVQSALTSRAGGACAAPSASPASASAAVHVSVPPPPAGSLTAATSAAVPMPLALLGGAAVIGALALGGRATLRRRRPGAAG